MITIINNQNIPLAQNELKNSTQEILNYLGYSDFAISIVLLDEHDMQGYNKKFRNKDKPTDILSFPYHPNLKAGEKINPQSDEDKNLGDILVCPQFIQNDLERWNQTFEQRINVLLVHGICHLLGYDHIQDADYEVMQKKENELLKILSC